MKFHSGKALVTALLSLILLGPVPSAESQDSLWRSYFNSAQKAYREQNYTEAERLLRSCLEAARKYDDSLISFYYLAKTSEKLGKLPQAEGHYQTVLEYLGPKIWSTLRPPEGSLDWDDAASDSDVLLSTQQFAQQFPKRKQPYSNKLAKPITTVDVLCDVGYLFEKEHKYDQAEQAYRQALELCEHRPASTALGQAGVMRKLSALYTAQGKTTESSAVEKQMDQLRNTSFPEFSKLVEKNLNDLNRFGANDALVATRLNNLALFCATHGDYTRADSLYKRSLENCKTSPVARKDVSTILRNYADLLQAMGRNDEAQKYLKQAESYKDVAEQRMQEARANFN